MNISWVKTGVRSLALVALVLSVSLGLPHVAHALPYPIDTNLQSTTSGPPWGEFSCWTDSSHLPDPTCNSAELNSTEIVGQFTITNTSGAQATAYILANGTIGYWNSSISAYPGEPLTYSWSLDPYIIEVNNECDGWPICSMDWHRVPYYSYYFNTAISSNFGYNAQYGTVTIVAPSSGNVVPSIGNGWSSTHWSSMLSLTVNVVTWTTYCTGGSDPNGNNWQWWQVSSATPPGYRPLPSGTNPPAGQTCGAAPTNLSSSCTSGTATLKWTNGSTYGLPRINGVTGSCPSSWTHGNPSDSTECDSPTPYSGTSATVPGLSAGTYNWWVTSYSGSTWGGTTNSSVTCAATVQAPTVTLAPSTQTITSGSSASFTYTLGGGTPTSITYKVDGGSAVTASGGGFNVAGLAVGSHTVVMTVSNSAGSNVSNTATVIVNSAVIAPTCTITSVTAPSTSGGHSTINYTTANTPTSGSVDNSIGSFTPTNPSGSLASGAITFGSSAQNITYHMTVTNAAGSGTCSGSVTIPAASCTDNGTRTCSGTNVINNCSTVVQSCSGSTPVCSAGSCIANTCSNGLNYSNYGPSCTCPSGQTQSGSSCVAAASASYNLTGPASIPSGTAPTLSYSYSNLPSTMYYMYIYSETTGSMSLVGYGPYAGYAASGSGSVTGHTQTTSETYQFYTYDVSAGGTYRPTPTATVNVTTPTCSNGLNYSNYGPSCTCPSGQTQSGSSCVAAASASYNLTGPASVTSGTAPTLSYSYSNLPSTMYLMYVYSMTTGNISFIGYGPYAGYAASGSGTVTGHTQTTSETYQFYTYDVSAGVVYLSSPTATVGITTLACPANCPGAGNYSCTANSGYTYNSSSNTCTLNTLACPANCPGSGNYSCTANSGYTYNSSSNTCTLNTLACPANCPGSGNYSCTANSGYTYNSSSNTCTLASVLSTFSAAPARVHSGGSAALSWTGTGLSGCAIAPTPAGVTISYINNTATGGSATVGPISGKTSFTLSCTGVSPKKTESFRLCQLIRRYNTSNYGYESKNCMGRRCSYFDSAGDGDCFLLHACRACAAAGSWYVGRHPTTGGSPSYSAGRRHH